MNFQEAEEYLLSLGNEVSSMKLGLENIRKLLAALRDPQNDYLKVQVAGTNGKGSVCAFLNAICLQAGIRTGMYTSPHLVSITERINIDGLDISESDFANIATEVREASELLVERDDLESVPTFFEQVTAIALLAFAEAKVELAILETGLGGRLDATTAANAEIVAITRIDLDHQEYLGDTLAEIAAEKAAIIHADSRAVILRQTREVEQVIVGRCREVGVDPVWSTTNIIVKRDPVVLPALIASFATERTGYSNILFWNLHGEHQIENAAVAIGVAEVLQKRGLSVDSDAIVIGLETARHRGRLEFVTPGILLDGAHNIGGARALRMYLDENIKQPITMIFGSMQDKDVKQIASVLFPKAEHLILTRPDNLRAISPEDLMAAVPPEFDGEKIFLADTTAAAVVKARELSGEDDLILVTGSLYLVGDVKRLLKFEI